MNQSFKQLGAIFVASIISAIIHAERHHIFKKHSIILISTGLFLE